MKIQISIIIIIIIILIVLLYLLIPLKSNKVVYNENNDKYIVETHMITLIEEFNETIPGKSKQFLT